MQKYSSIELSCNRLLKTVLNRIQAVRGLMGTAQPRRYTMTTVNRTYKWMLMILLAMPCYSFAADLGKAEAFVILDIVDKNGNIDSLRFKEFTTGEIFSVSADMMGKPVVIKAGNYYLDKILTISDNVPPIIFNQPKDIKLTYKIFPGAVTYIGTWYFDDTIRSNVNTKLKISKDYPEKLFKTLVKNDDYLTKYPLIIATEKGELFKRKWEQAITE